MTEGEWARFRAVFQAQWLTEEATHARSRSQRMAAKAVQLAMQMAATEDALADTLSRVAQEQPRHAARLRKKISAARDRAAYERHWARAHFQGRQRPASGEADGRD